MLDEMASQELLLGLFLAGAGLAFMLLGLRLSKILVGLSFGVIGMVLGGTMLTPPVLRLIGGLLMAIGLGIVAVWAYRPSVAILAGTWGALLTFCFVAPTHMDIYLIWGFVAIGFFVCASLAFALFNEIIAIITSFQGTILFIAGLIIFLAQSPVLWNHVRGMFVEYPIFGGFLLLAGTVSGFCFQMSEMQKKQVGMAM
jgi:hypothetical protein